jgi:hypothetical protein
MLEEINRSVREMEEDEQQLRVINERDQRDESMPIEPATVQDLPSSQDKDKPGADKAAAEGADDTEPRKVSAVPGGDPAKSDNDE